jgi:hypothetical protein
MVPPQGLCHVVNDAPEGGRFAAVRRLRCGACSHSTEAERHSSCHAASSRIATDERNSDMALSDQLSQLAARAKQFEDRANASRQKAKGDLEQDVKHARDSAQAHAESLRESAEARKGKISASWDNLQRSWNEHIASIRKAVDDRKAEHDTKAAQRRADLADDDAAFAIDYAYAAIEEAEYAVLDAELARMEADDRASANAAS